MNADRIRSSTATRLRRGVLGRPGARPVPSSPCQRISIAFAAEAISLEGITATR